MLYLIFFFKWKYLFIVYDKFYFVSSLNFEIFISVCERSKVIFVVKIVYCIEIS